MTIPTVPLHPRREPFGSLTEDFEPRWGMPYPRSSELRQQGILKIHYYPGGQLPTCKIEGKEMRRV